MAVLGNSMWKCQLEETIQSWCGVQSTKVNPSALSANRLGDRPYLFFLAVLFVCQLWYAII